MVGAATEDGRDKGNVEELRWLNERGKERKLKGDGKNNEAGSLTRIPQSSRASTGPVAGANVL